MRLSRPTLALIALGVALVGPLGSSSASRSPGILTGCALPAGEPCCEVDLECKDGLRCFEGRCAARCDDDAQCAEGELCVELADVCRARDPNAALERCPYDAPDAGAPR